MSLTKADIANYLSKNLDLNKKEATLIVNNFFEKIGDFLEQGYEVKFSGFGNFSCRYKKARLGRIIKQNKEITIPAHLAIIFHAGVKCRKIVLEKGELRDNNVAESNALKQSFIEKLTKN